MHSRPLGLVTNTAARPAGSTSSTKQSRPPPLAAASCASATSSCSSAMAAEAAVAADLESRFDGFKACFGGEELKRACATLSGALICGALPAPLDVLAEDRDLHVRDLAFAARQYEAATTSSSSQPGSSLLGSSEGEAAAAGPPDYETLYHHGLVLQELAGRLPAGSGDQAALLRRACGRYEGALALNPASHAALYNWGVALSDLARAIKAQHPVDAAAALHLASQKYAAALALHPRNSQALNNWGLVLQELSCDARSKPARDGLVRAARDKFRLALRLRPDFDRGVYNLGTVFYTAAMGAQAEPEPAAAPGRPSRDLAVRALLSVAAQYIALAHALQPGKEIYRKSLGVVRGMLPLPFLRAGYLTAPRARSIGSVTETYRRDWFVLDQRSLRQASSMEASLSTAGAGVPSGAAGGGGGAAAAQAAGAAGGAAGGGGDDEPLVVRLDQLLTVRRCAEPSIPEGGGIWVSTQERPAGIYLVADDADAADAWVDALVLCQHLVSSRCSVALEEALAPATTKRSKHGLGG